MSLSGVKRTWPIAVHMSAFDPKRTSQVTLTRSLHMIVGQEPFLGMMGLEISPAIGGIRVGGTNRSND
jgi:hypothetical protein